MRITAATELFPANPIGFTHFQTIEVILESITGWPGRSAIGSHISEYTPDRVRWILLIGSVPSAAGARAPLSSIMQRYTFYPHLFRSNHPTYKIYQTAITNFSHVSVSVSRWAVERYRWRTPDYSLIIEREIFKRMIVEFGLGLLLRWGGAKMRFFNAGIGCEVPTLCVDPQ